MSSTGARRILSSWPPEVLNLIKKYWSSTSLSDLVSRRSLHKRVIYSSTGMILFLTDIANSHGNTAKPRDGMNTDISCVMVEYSHL